MNPYLSWDTLIASLYVISALNALPVHVTFRSELSSIRRHHVVDIDELWVRINTKSNPLPRVQIQNRLDLIPRRI